MNTEEIEDDPEIDLLNGEVVEKETEVPAKDPNEDLRNAVQELTRIQTEAAKPREEKPAELTEAQKAEMWAVYNPKAAKPDFMKKFFRLNPDATPEDEAEAEALFADMQKGFVRQAIKGSMNIHQAEMQKLREEIAPLQKFYSDEQAAKLRNRFGEAYEDFKDPKYNKLLELADRAQAGKKFATEADYFKAVAETAAEALKTGQPDFVLGAAKKQTTKPTGLTARSPRLVSGSGSGAGNTSSGNGKAAVDDLEGIFDIP